MKFIIFLTLLVSVRGYAQQADAIVGKWLKANKEDLIIDVYKSGESYSGKINWSKDNKKPAGFIMLDKLKYRAKEKSWQGVVHDPKSGRSYDATVTMKQNGMIEVSGGVLMFKVKRLFRRVT